ncbi:cobalamin B12-binding domain-containing protein [Streptomyces sp. NPDC088816]|uniref:cobalamin B12-binding domain-containing protein n=1 Tax=Streptomyces sp. NPDC088816 TaxID=3365906 RepID=UPI0038124F4C
MAQRENHIVGLSTPPAHRDRGTVVVSGLASDAHTWNLVYLQLVIEELGYHVINLGPCVPDDVLVAECRRIDPVLLVIGSVNGHGSTDGLRAVTRLRACPELAATPMVIGGKLTVSDEDIGRHARALMAAGFDAVFPDQASDAADFTAFVASLPSAARPALTAGRSR